MSRSSYGDTKRRRAGDDNIFHLAKTSIVGSCQQQSEWRIAGVKRDSVESIRATSGSFKSGAEG